MRYHRSISRSCVAVAALALGASVSVDAGAAQTLRNKRIYFGDVHWHSCLSQDATSTPTSQYWSMLYDYGLDFSMETEHVEAADAGVIECDDYLPMIHATNGSVMPHSGNNIANAMKAAANEWNGRELASLHHGLIKFVTFPGYEWSPDARCWASTSGDPYPNDLNSDDTTPGHISYFFSDTTGWSFGHDVWGPGPGPSSICVAASAIGITYYEGTKDYLDELLGQLIHQRDDPDRSYDLLIQYNHPAASIDKGGDSDHLAKWYDFARSNDYCSIASSIDCEQSQCEAMRRAYAVNSVEWYTNQEATIGSREVLNGGGEEEDVEYHDHFHRPAYYVSSRGLKEGFRLAATGGSDSHDGRMHAPKGLTKGRGAGSGSLTAVYAAEPSRPGIWEGVSRKRTYALSRFRGIGPVHKGRVDLFTTEELETLPEVGFRTAAFALPGGPVGGEPTVEYGMGESVETLEGGTLRNFTVSAGAEEGTTGVYPREVRLYRVGPNTVLSEKTDWPAAWLDDVPGDPGKLGEPVGRFVNEAQASVVAPTFQDVLVRPGDAVFAVVPFSDDDWVDTYYARDESQLDADGDGAPDPGKSGYVHHGNATWARTSPIFFYTSQERPDFAPACENVTFNYSGAVGEQAAGGVDEALPGDNAVLPVAVADFYDKEWNRWRFSLQSNYDYVDLSFLTASDDHEPGTLFAIRIDGKLVYSGRSSIDHEADALVDLRDVYFPIKAGLHQLEVHMDDQEYATDNNPDYSCTDYDGAAAFVDAVMFHKSPGGQCYDVTPPVVSCPPAYAQECAAPGGAPAGALVAVLGSASAVDDYDQDPQITHDAPSFLPLGTTPITFTATDDSGNAGTCITYVTVRDTTPPSLSPLELTPARLRWNSHLLAPIGVSRLRLSDVCDPAPALVCSVGSDEPPDGRGDGHTRFDMLFDWRPVFTQSTGEREIDLRNGRGHFDLALRAERSSTGDGRVYTARCQALDATGNHSPASSDTVVVPR